MRKLFGIFLSFIFTQNILAYESLLTVSCALPEVQDVHRFQAFGVFKLEEGQKVTGTLTIQLIKGTEARSVMQFDQVHMEGKLEKFETQEGEGLDSYEVLTLSTDVPYLDSVDLFFGNLPLASKIQSIDNFSYRSDCKFFY